MGFVVVKDMETDILIRPGDFNTAMHGDTVIVKTKAGGGRRMQGEVVEVVTRKRTEFIGHLEMNNGFAFFVADGDKPMPDLFIPLSSINNAKDKDRGNSPPGKMGEGRQASRRRSGKRDGS
jgi:ribonuclease R